MAEFVLLYSAKTDSKCQGIPHKMTVVGEGDGNMVAGLPVSQQDRVAFRAFFDLPVYVGKEGGQALQQENPDGPGLELMPVIVNGVQAPGDF